MIVYIQSLYIQYGGMIQKLWLPVKFSIRMKKSGKIFQDSRESRSSKKSIVSESNMIYKMCSGDDS